MAGGTIPRDFAATMGRSSSVSTTGTLKYVERLAADVGRALSMRQEDDDEEAAGDAFPWHLNGITTEGSGYSASVWAEGTFSAPPALCPGAVNDELPPNDGPPSTWERTGLECQARLLVRVPATTLTPGERYTIAARFGSGELFQDVAGPYSFPRPYEPALLETSGSGRDHLMELKLYDPYYYPSPPPEPRLYLDVAYFDAEGVQQEEFPEGIHIGIQAAYKLKRMVFPYVPPTED